MNELISLGDKVKGIDRARRRVGGYGIRFSGPGAADLDGEFFTKSTDLWDPKTAWAIFDHGKDPALKQTRLGELALKTDDNGVWVEGDLIFDPKRWHASVAARAEKYLDMVYALVEDGKLGWSSGAAPHLVHVTKDGEIKCWPVVEFSLTPSPAEFRNRVLPLKSYFASREKPAAKAGRAISTANWDRLHGGVSQMREQLDGLMTFLEEHKPQANDDNDREPSGSAFPPDSMPEEEIQAQAALLLHYL